MAYLALLGKPLPPNTNAPHHLPPSTHRYMHPGDIAKCLIICLCGSFLAAITLHESGHLHVFSSSYLEDGFCVSNKEGHALLQGHALSFYADAVTTLLMFALVHLGRHKAKLSEAALTPVAKNAISLFGHGLGHAYLAASALAPGGSALAFESLSTRGRVVAFAVLFPVWLGFVRDKRRSLVVSCSLAAAHNALQVWMLPTRFFFTHVLLAVLGGSAVRWLSKPASEKTRYYALESWLVDVPIMLASFGEALSCDAFLARFGGHVWFDMVVPIGFCAYVAVLVLSGDGDGDCKQPTPLPPRKQRTDPVAVACSISQELRPVALHRSSSSGMTDSVGLARRSGQPGEARQLSEGMLSCSVRRRSSLCQETRVRTGGECSHQSSPEPVSATRRKRARNVQPRAARAGTP